MNNVTLLVFKDHMASRTFQVPLRWLRSIGYLVTFITLLSVLSTFFAIKYYRTVQRVDPARLHDLEQELGDLQNAYHSVEGKLAAAQAASTVNKVTAPQPTVTTPPLTASANSSQTGFLFSAIPANAGTELPDMATLPVKMSDPKVNWRGRTLHVHFEIQYTRTDGGNQQGHIILLARGAKTLLGYPDKVLNPAGQQALINPAEGEYFSVSRFRETNADFGPISSKEALKSVDILVFDSGGKIIYYRNVPTESAGKAHESTASQ